MVALADAVDTLTSLLAVPRDHPQTVAVALCMGPFSLSERCLATKHGRPEVLGCSHPEAPRNQ